MDKALGPEPIPIMLTNQSRAGEAAGPFQAGKVVKLPYRAGTDILIDPEVAGQPIDPLDGSLVDDPLAAFLDLLALERFLTRIQACGDSVMIRLEIPCAGHAGGGNAFFGCIGQLPSGFWALSQ